MHYSKLSADPTALILGILSLIIGFGGCCCYGFFAIIPLSLSIIGIVMANKSLKEFDQNPNIFSQQSRSNVYIGKILNIIALVYNSIVFILVLIALVFFGVVSSSEIFDKIKNDTIFEDYQITSDSIYQNYEYIEKVDTTYIDSTLINNN
ncbi:CCC motif membrane protein [uncultured Flavobacterium sp.]|uniref:CCC motif membrane protein n=1 Tax=uncultured Flavobacterium sp. TaxID=165435 RepID=UPI0030CA1E8E